MQSNSKKLSRIGSIGILFIAVIARSIHINSSFWLDEAAQAIESARPLSEQLNIIPDFQPPLYHLLVHMWMSGGTQEWWLRLTSVIPGLITILLAMLLAKKWFSAHTAYITGILLATSQFHVFYSQELRPYSVAACLGLAMVYSYSFLGTKTKTALVGLTLSSIAGCYTTYLFPLVPFTLFIITAIWHRSYVKFIGGVLVVTGIAYIPWLPTFSAQLQAGTGLAANSNTWSQIVSPPLLKMIPLTAFKFIFGRIPAETTLPAIALYSLIFLITGLVCLKTRNHPRWKEIVVLILGPIIVSFLISFKVPVLDPKRILFCLPFMYILIASSIENKPKGSLILAFFLVINMVGLSRYGQDADVQREPWREAVQTISGQLMAGDQVVFAFPQAFAPWLWYADPAIKTVTQPIATPFSDNRYIVFDYLMDMTDPERNIHKNLQNDGYYEASFLQYPGIGKIRFFAQSSMVGRLP